MMKWPLLYVFLLHLYTVRYCDGAPGWQKKNEERARLRKKLLANYDPIVGPVRYTRDNRILNVQFKLTVNKLVEVNTKDEYLKLDTWVVQIWKDDFLKWNPAKFGKIFNVYFSRNEIWVPDIALLNNADSTERLAGGPTKFITNVWTTNNGQCHWLSPATFTSTCQQNVKVWPMDSQTCYLIFGSPTYSNFTLRIKLPNKNGKSYQKGSISNGEWTIEAIDRYLGTNQLFDDDRYFSTIVYKISLKRKPGYILFFFCPPAIVLVVLSIMSFFIPIESGERISFVTTTLLALMVFLLMIPEYLPRTSDLPILGILLMMSMVLIAAILVATIFVLMCYHKTTKPSFLIRKLFFPCRASAAVAPMLIRVKEVKNERKGNDIELKKRMEDKMSESCDKSIDARMLETDCRKFEDENQLLWQAISKKLNWIFFWLCCTLLIGIAIWLFG